MKSPRRRLLVDPTLQGALTARVVVYWFLALAVMFALVLAQSWIAGRGVDWPVMVSRTLTQFGPALVAAVVLLPLVVFDALRFSHRFAGPVHRLKGETRRLANGETLQPIVFRQGDYWADLATEFNRLSDEVHRLRREAAGNEQDRRTEPCAPASN